MEQYKRKFEENKLHFDDLHKGLKVKMLRGAYKGKVGSVEDWSANFDEITVKFSDHSVRYPGIDDIQGA